jgi:hypothetical protein
MHRSEFLKLLKDAFPELVGSLNQQQGLLHFEMGQFRKFTQVAIAANDHSRLQRCFAIAAKAYHPP